MWTELPTDLRLIDGWCWQPVKALLLSSLGASARWSSGSTHMTTGAKHMENLAGLPEMKSLMLELSIAAESAMSRRGMGVVGLPELQGGKLHGRHSVSAQGAHAGGELVQSPGGDLHVPGNSPSHDGQVRPADRSGKAQPRYTDAKHGVGLD